MRKILFLIVLLIAGFTVSAWAHPPQTVVVTFDPETWVISATIIHPVSNAEKHYIFKVDVLVNGQEIISQKITRQSDPMQEKVLFRIPDIKAGDTVTVEAYCNISGKGVGAVEVK
jgi:hypothetical protein